jgi:oligosaccharide repeat unit polymerase
VLNLTLDLMLLGLAYFATVGTMPIRRQALHPTTWIFVPLIVLFLLALFDDRFVLLSGDTASIVMATFCASVVFGHFYGALFFPKRQVDLARAHEVRPTWLFNWAMIAIVGVLAYDFWTNAWSDVGNYALTIRLLLIEGDVSQPFVYRFFLPLFLVYATVISLSRSMRRPALALALLLAAALLYDFLKVDKGTLKVLAVGLIATLYTMDRVKAIAVATLVLFTGYTGITYMRTGDDDIYSITLRHLYDDTVGNVFSFYWSIANPFPENYTHTFPQTALVLGQLVGAREIQMGGPFDSFYLADIGWTYNTFPALSYIYADFGLLGVCAAGYLFAVFNQFAMYKAGRHTKWLVALPIVSMGYLFLFRGFVFGALGIWLAVALCVATPKLVFSVSARRHRGTRRGVARPAGSLMVNSARPLPSD